MKPKACKAARREKAAFNGGAVGTEAIALTAPRWLLPGIILALMTAGCATSPGSETATPSQSEAPTSTPESSPTPADLGTVDDALVGSWQAVTGGGSLELDADGTFALYAADGQLDVEGEWGVNGDAIALRDRDWGPVGGPCGATPEEPYLYTWSIEGDRLSFVLVDDDCPDRWTVGTDGFERRS